MEALQSLCTFVAMQLLRLKPACTGVQVQRPQVQPVIIQDLFIFRAIAKLANSFARKRLGTNAELILDEFAEKLLEELDYRQEARNIEVRFFPVGTVSVWVLSLCGLPLLPCPLRHLPVCADWSPGLERLSAQSNADGARASRGPLASQSPTF